MLPKNWLCWMTSRASRAKRMVSSGRRGQPRIRQNEKRRQLATALISGAGLKSERLEARVLLSLSSVFQIDGNAATTVTSPLSHDWDQVFHDKGGVVSPDPGPSGTGALQFSSDPINSSSDDTFNSTSKDTADINTWGWKSGKPNSKSDLEHGFAAAYQDEGYSTNGSVHTLLYVGADRYDNVGSSTLGVWFLHNPIAKSGTTSGGFVFKGTNTPYTHADGDVLFVANFASGAVSFTAYKWNNVTKTIPSVGTPLTSDQGLAFANASPVSVPWAYTTKSGKTSPQANQLLEFGVDLNQLFATSGASLPDFSSYIISTRTSNSATATLQDFIIRDVSSAPDVAVTKTPDAATVNAGSQVGYTVSVSNVGVGNLSGVTFNDPLPAGAASDLNWTFASGGNPGGLFQITGSVGNQVLSLISPQNMAFNAAPLVAHVVARSSTSDLGKITSTATVAAIGEGSNFLTNNSAAADIVIMPVALNDTYFTPLNTTLTVPASGVLSNDGTPLTNVTATLVSGPSQGSLTMNANGDGGFTYAPARNSSSTVTFTYKDNLFGNFSNIATVTINIGANHPPVTVNDSNSVTEDSVLTASGNVLSNDSDLDAGTTLAATLVGSGAGTYGSVTISSGGGYTYTLNNSAAVVQGLAQGQSVTDTFTYAASDGIASTNGTLTITINGTNDGPVAVNDTASTNEDNFVDVVVVSNDMDIDSSNSVLVVASGSIANVHGGTATLQPDGRTIRFTPTADANGTTPGGFGFDYKVSDGSLTSANTGTVTITVTEVNDTPSATDDSLGSVAEDSATRVIPFADLTGNDSKGPPNESGQALTITDVSNAVGGTVVINGTNVEFTPTANFNGAASFDYTVQDNGTTNGSNAFLTDLGTASFTVTEVNDAPTATDDSLSSVAEDSATRVIAFAELTGNDSMGPTNESGQALTVTAVSNATGGTVVINGSNVEFTPAANFNGAASFDYTVSDNGTTNGSNAFLTDLGTVTFTITEVDDGPTVTLNGASSANEGQTKHYTFTTSDPDGGTFNFVVASPSGGLVGSVTNATIDGAGAGSFDVTFSDGLETCVVSVQITDGETSSNVSSISVTVNNVEPTVSISGSTTVEALTTYALTLEEVTDPGLDTVTTYIVHWGDGTSDTYSTLGVKAHTYLVSQTAIITVDLVDEDGLFLDQANPLSVTVTEPFVRRFDFNASVATPSHGVTPNDTQSGFIGVNGSKLYADGDGYGFLSVVDDYSRGQSTVTTKTSLALYQDFVRGTSAGTFQLSVPVDQVYNLRFYSGDTGFAHDLLRITIEGGGVAGYAKTASPTDNSASTDTILPFTTVSFTGIQDLNDDGILTIVFSDLTVSGSATATYEPYRWVVNGLDIWWVDTDGNPLTDLNDPGVAPLTSGSAASTASSDAGLTIAALAPIVTEAIARWSATGLNSAQVAMLKAITFQIIDLDARRQLGSASEAEGKIQLDDNANGHGWFIDNTARDNREFARRGLPNELRALPNGPAAGHMDLLTVVMHEMGHILGLDHTANSHSLMAEELSTGLRRLPFRETPFAMPSIAVGTGHLTATRSQVTTPAVTASTLVPPTFRTKHRLIAVETQFSGNDLKRDDDRDAVFANLMRIFDDLEMI